MQRTNRIIASLIFICSFLFVLFTCIITALLIILDHTNFCHLFLNWIGKPNKETFFIEHILTVKKYNVLRIILGLGSLFLILFNIYILKKRFIIFFRISTLINEVIQMFCNQLIYISKFDSLIKFTFYAILIVQLIYFTFQAIIFPISYDEAWTYLNFTSKSIITSMSYYPAPNNHVFFSTLTNLFEHFSIINPKIRIRLINVLLSLILSFLFLKLLTTFFSKRVSLFILVLFIFSYPVALYSIQARGYLLLLMFSLLSIYSCIQYLFVSKRKQLFTYLIAVVLGFYTIPSYLYCFVSLQVFSLYYCVSKKQYIQLRNIIKYNCIAGLAVVILYSPIIFFNGISSITSNNYVKSIPFNQITNSIIQHTKHSADWLFGLENGGIYILIFVLFLLYKLSINNDNDKELKSTSKLMLIMLVLPLFLIFLQRVIPFERTWIYLLIPIYFGVATFTSVITKMIPVSPSYRNLLFIAASLFAMITLTLKFPIDYKRLHDLDYEADATFISKDINSISKIASNDLFMTDLMTYHLIIQNKNKQIQIMSIPYDSIINADALFIKNNSKVNIPNLNEYTLISKNNYIRFYTKKQQY